MEEREGEQEEKEEAPTKLRYRHNNPLKKDASLPIVHVSVKSKLQIILPNYHITCSSRIEFDNEHQPIISYHSSDNCSLELITKNIINLKGQFCFIIDN